MAALVITHELTWHELGKVAAMAAVVGVAGYFARSPLAKD
jgi:hypothetical protein